MEMARERLREMYQESAETYSDKAEQAMNRNEWDEAINWGEQLNQLREEMHQNGYMEINGRVYEFGKPLPWAKCRYTP